MNYSYSKPLLCWLERGFIGFVSGTWVITPKFAMPQTHLLMPTSKSFLMAQASISDVPVSITGRLDQNSPTLTDGSYYQEHTFRGTAGEAMVIELSSDEFDTYLYLKSPSGEVIAENDDWVFGTTNSTIVITLPTTGVYGIIANTIDDAENGSYRLERRISTETDRVLAEAVQLNQQASERYQTGRYAEANSLAEQSLFILEQTLGANHPGVAESLVSLAFLYQAQGKYAQAEPLWQRSLSILEQTMSYNYFWCTA